MTLADRTSLALALALAVLSPIAARGQAPSPPPATVRVALPNDHNLQWMSFWAAQGAGYFVDEGLRVDVVAGTSGGDEGGRGAVDALLGGSADIAVLPRPLYLIAVGEGEPVLAFANLLRNDPINLVVRADVADERGLSLELPLADRLNGLRGLRIGVAPGPLSRLRVLMGSAGLDADIDIEVVVVPGESQNQAFADRRIDALYAHTPFLERALAAQGAVMIVNQSAGEVPELSNRQIHMLVTTREFRDQMPEILRDVTRAVYRAQALIHTDREAAKAAIRASDVRLEAPDALDLLLDIYEPAIPLTPEVSVAGALRELALFPSRRAVPDLGSIDLADFIDNGFAERAVLDD